MFLSIVPFLYSKRTAVTRSLVSLIESERFVAVLSELAVELPSRVPKAYALYCLHYPLVLYVRRYPG